MASKAKSSTAIYASSDLMSLVPRRVDGNQVALRQDVRDSSAGEYSQEVRVLDKTITKPSKSSFS